MHIPHAKELEQKVFAITNEKEFLSIALEVFQFQYENNPVYHDYCNAVRRSLGVVKELTDIPFLPISFFKTHKIETTLFEPEVVFKSSGTTGAVTSSHYVKDHSLYIKSFLQGFKRFYGDPKHYCIIGLLPSYLERGNSSLVFMVDYLIKESGHPQSGFYLREFEKLSRNLNELEEKGQKTILIGVTYALLDFAGQMSRQLKSTIVMETGGMKGRGKELTKQELYDRLKIAFGVAHIHSEYGMTELLSQAYGVDGNMDVPPWMKILFRDEADPFHISQARHPVSGAINIIDLANLYSCCFIATDDIGKSFAGGGFGILGRMDNSDIRGCSLMII